MNTKPKESGETGDSLHTESASLLDQVELEAPKVVDGVVAGVLASIEPSGVARVTFAGCSGPVRAQSAAPLHNRDLGARVALMFLDGSPDKPMIMGKLRDSLHEDREAVVDGDRVLLEAEKEIVLRCGKASIILRRDGKVIIKGTHLVNRSSGSNKIKGASVQIN